MTRPLDVDRVLDDWLAEGPSRLPDRVVDATIGQLDDIRQRKPTWLPGSERMHRLILSATGVAAAVIVAVVALGSLNGGRQPGGPTPTGAEFVSERHRYSVTLVPGTWTREERPGSWELGTFLDPNTVSGVDYFERLDTTPTRSATYYLYLASQPIPAGMAIDAWMAAHDAANQQEQPCFGLVGAFEQRVLDGETARIGAHRCDDFGGEGVAWTNVQVLVARAGRGYAIYAWPSAMGSLMPPLEDVRAVADEWLAGFTFND